jgi:hypothetical protein
MTTESAAKSDLPPARLASDEGSASAVWLPRIAALGGVAYFVIHSLRVLLGSPRVVMEWLYDDTFYYMITASHFSERHISSFDGITVTSGYHPLWMWLCAAIYSLHGRLDLTFVRSCMALTFVITSAILLCVLRDAILHRRSGILWAIGLGTSSYSALNNGITVMEWPLVVLCWFLLHTLLTGQAQQRRAEASLLATAFCIGFAGSFSRTDFGLIPASYLAASILLAVLGRRWASARTSAAAMVGSLTALPVIFLYNQRLTGDWLQSSAQVKRLAASLANPFNPVPAAWQFLRVLFYTPSLELDPELKIHLLSRALSIVAVSAVLLLIGVVVWRRTLWRWLAPLWPADGTDQLAVTAAAIGIPAYLFVYAFNTQATYGWYTASVTGFTLLLAARIFAIMPSRIAAPIVFSLMLANMATAQWRGGNARSQMQEVIVGQAMHIEHPGAQMGGGDVGKPSFYNGGTMINLDGLMNNEVVPYLASGRIQCYILRRHIEYLSGVGTVSIPITDAERARHGDPPMPWNQYFIPIPMQPTVGPDGTLESGIYLRTDFAAIRASGECPADQ